MPPQFLYFPLRMHLLILQVVDMSLSLSGRRGAALGIQIPLGSAPQPLFFIDPEPLTARAAGGGTLGTVPVAG